MLDLSCGAGTRLRTEDHATSRPRVAYLLSHVPKRGQISGNSGSGGTDLSPCRGTRNTTGDNFGKLAVSDF